MHIQSVPNRNSPLAILLRESYREGGKARKRTLCSLSDWRKAHVEGLCGVLKGGTVIAPDRDAFTVARAFPDSHVAAALGMARKTDLGTLIGPAGNRWRDLVLATIVARVTNPGSKLATARALAPETASCSLGILPSLGQTDKNELYAALDWLAKPHLQIVYACCAHRTGGPVAIEVFDGNTATRQRLPPRSAS